MLDGYWITSFVHAGRPIQDNSVCDIFSELIFKQFAALFKNFGMQKHDTSIFFLSVSKKRQFSERWRKLRQI